MSAQAKDTAQKLIEEHDFALFSKTWCPYCKKVKAVIDGLDLDPSAVGILELDEMGQEGKEIQSYLEGETGQSTVPSVWIKKEFIGGSSDLNKIPTAELQKRVKSAV
ncbi:MAG: glutaredoxin [Cyphobasidiales sp. Tagirdzhanova-0007]|nr:MAG: glutaredoxin [Cyphobasidiales sp. Tagirdzhanova-0007]